MSAKNKQELRVVVHGPCTSALPSPLHPPSSAYTPLSGLPLSAYKPQFSPYDFSPLYTPVSARMPAYPRTPLHSAFPPTPASSDDCPLDLNTPFETSGRYLRDFDNFFSTKLFRQNGDITSKVLPPPSKSHVPSPRVEFFKRDKLPSIQKTMLRMRDFENTTFSPTDSYTSTSTSSSTSSSTCSTLVRTTPTDEMPNYVTTSPKSPGSDSDSSCFSPASPEFKLTSPPQKKVAFRPYKVQKTKPASAGAAASKKQLAVEMVAGHVGLVKKEHSLSHPSSPSPADSPFGRGMAPSTNGMSNVERLKANPDMWTQATQVKKGVYVCTHCPSHLGRFRKLSELAAHFDENNLTRLCKCDFPDCAWSIVGFSSRSEKTRHIKSQHATARYECLHCERVFARSDSLKRHFKLIHNLPNVSPEELLSMRTKAPSSSADASIAYDSIKEEDQESTVPPPSSTSIFVVAQS